MDKKIIKELQKKLGKDKIFVDREYLVAYSYDATGNQFMPDLVAFPENEEDIKNLLKIAYKYRIPVTPRGAGVGYSGGSLPIDKGIVLVFTRMNKILKIDTRNLYAEVEPGVITQQLQLEVEKKGLFYPPDPASLKTSTLGGNVAENAGGLRCFKYGVTGNYVLGLEGFLVNGEKIKAGAPVIKDVAGYNVKSLLVGSEGTLAVVTKIILRLIPLPEHRVTFRVDFKSLNQGAEFINKVILANISPSALEFMDRTSIAAVCKYLGIDPGEDVNASVLIEIDGNRADIEQRKNRFVTLVQESDVLSYKTAETPEEQEEVWNIRRNISPAISKLKPKKINEDIVVPTGRIPDTIEYINRLAREKGLTIIMFGHFGDGNIHTNLMVDPDDLEEMEKAEQALDEIFKYVISVQGSITGEHGVGISKKPFMGYQFTPVEIEIFKGIKRTFDPHNLLNPGKIF